MPNTTNHGRRQQTRLNEGFYKGIQAKMVEGVCVIKEKEELEPGGVEIDWNLSEWFIPFS